MGLIDVGRVKLNRATMNMMLSGGLGMRGILQANANAVAASARTRAPVVTGEYRDSIRVQSVVRNERSGTRRLVFQVVAGAPYSRQVERRHSVLAKALGASAGQVRRRR